jgi:hypothetical protein
MCSSMKFKQGFFIFSYRQEGFRGSGSHSDLGRSDFLLPNTSGFKTLLQWKWNPWPGKTILWHVHPLPS